MRLELLIPTLRRPQLLQRALESVARADRPRRLEIAVTVVNNDTRPELPGSDSLLASIPFPTGVLHEPRSGKSAALNAGIAASTADYVGFIDDDEELARDWFCVVEAALESAPADFLGGRVLLLPGTDFPKWVPTSYAAILGAADSGPAELPYGPDFPGMLKGGNAVISRAMLSKVGPYTAELGPTLERRLLSCEDEDMYLRLVAVGARGRYLPNLIVYHCVHTERLQKSYYRAWSFWQGVSKGVLDRRSPAPVPHIAAVPRYAYGEAIRGLFTWMRAALGGGPADVRLAAELRMLNLAGRLYGAHRRGHRLAPSSPATPVEEGEGAIVL